MNLDAESLKKVDMQRKVDVSFKKSLKGKVMKLNY